MKYCKVEIITVDYYKTTEVITIDYVDYPMNVRREIGNTTDGIRANDPRIGGNDFIPTQFDGETIDLALEMLADMKSSLKSLEKKVEAVDKRLEAYLSSAAQSYQQSMEESEEEKDSHELVKALDGDEVTHTQIPSRFNKESFEREVPNVFDEMLEPRKSKILDTPVLPYEQCEESAGLASKGILNSPEFISFRVRKRKDTISNKSGISNSSFVGHSRCVEIDCDFCEIGSFKINFRYRRKYSYEWRKKIFEMGGHLSPNKMLFKRLIMHDRLCWNDLISIYNQLGKCDEFGKHMSCYGKSIKLVGNMEKHNFELKFYSDDVESGLVKTKFVEKLLRGFWLRETEREVLDVAFEKILVVVQQLMEEYSSPDFRENPDEAEAIHRLNLHMTMTNLNYNLWSLGRMIELNLADTVVKAGSEQVSIATDLRKKFIDDLWRAFFHGLLCVVFRCTCRLARTIISRNILVATKLRMQLVKDWIPVLIICKERVPPFRSNNMLMYVERGIVSSGWVMNDEANSYQFIIIVSGNMRLNEAFGIIPKKSWLIDCYDNGLVVSMQVISLIEKQGSLIKFIQETTDASVRVISNDEVPNNASANEGVVELQKAMNSMALRQGITLVVDVVVTHLKSRARMFSTLEEIARVWTISVNGKRKFGVAMLKIGGTSEMEVGDKKDKS